MRIVVLFNLRDGVDEAAYQAWAKATDIPVVNGLASIGAFSVHRVTGMLGSDARPPYQYIEVIDVADMDQFGQDVATETMKRVSAEFQTFADNPIFLTTQDLA